ncbi:NFX1-type zinc finger-containing protein 1-like [Neocloeon triangulifer]|uniref:NFX1-type zinc finger-containing protein 1-like n=1 Tax=Neocloeon triangulifer TaxID=2078957 RepID=UPI00286EC19F|nr:NFX1-type zinc finger-containing protein 1-like [Neocloeon triangulifer]
MEEDENPTFLPPAPRRRLEGNNAAGTWRAQAATLSALNLDSSDQSSDASRPAFRPSQHHSARGSRGRGRGGFGSFSRGSSVPRDFQSRGNSHQARFDQNFVETLQELVDLPSSQVVSKLAGKSDQWDEFVKGDLTLSNFQLVLRVLRKVCESEFDKHKAMLVNQTCHPDFLNCFPTMLLNGSMQDSSTFTQVAENIALFFTTLVTMLPITASGLTKTVQCCLLSLSGISNQDSVPVSSELLEKYKILLGDIEALQVNAPKKQTFHDRRKEQVEEMKYEQPPNDFREISIYPTYEDIVNPEKPFLRPNVIDGAYFNVDHYLDVQFRLLREDFVRPLREGVQGILKGTVSRKCESLSVRVYKDVQFLEYVREVKGGRVVSEGTLLCFDTSNGKRSQKTDWEQTKKFMHGALLCFTQNCFQTLLFATVSSREVKFLKQRQILVKFCQNYKENVFDNNAKYMMVESEVYFEPYYQVLRSLKRLSSWNFPFPEYFIDVEIHDDPPRYLLENEPNVQIEIEGAKRSHQVTILNEATWPSAHQLGLDDSQYEALKAALTKELAVIQGPPGTGKTFMALKIAEILILNKIAMNRKTPILVVCLTNHALDQFLVGMLKFTKRLVRIGGQSKCRELDDYNLKQMFIPRSRPKDQWSIREKLKNYYNVLLKLDENIADFRVAVELREGIVIPDNHGYGMRRIPPVLHSSIVSTLGLDSRYYSFRDLRREIKHYWTEKCLEEIKMNEHISHESKQFYTQQVIEQGQYFTNMISYLEMGAAEVDADLSRGKNLAASNSWAKLRSTNISDLCELHYFFLHQVMLELEEQRTRLLQCISEDKEILDEMQLMDKINALGDQDVIGLTTTGAARLHSMLSTLGCQIVIVEEAAEVMESHVVSCISKQCEHLILIGDHKQLRPKISDYELGKFYNFDVSLFERMVINRKGCITLQVQHRMAPEIAKLLVPTIYKTLENHHSVYCRPNLKSLTQRLSFVTHSEPEHQDKDNSSRANPYEASFLISLCQHLLKQGYDPNQITMLTTYKGQMYQMKSMIKSISPSDEGNKLANVRVSVVDDFQGEESDIILLSLVRSNSEGRIGFLATENRVCVALSRAKQGMVIMGDMGILSAKNATWKSVQKSILDQNALHSSLTLRCEVHPDFKFEVKNPSDFQQLAPYGGCNQICEDQLDCGHPCNFVCHLMQIKHADIKCELPCERKCDAGLHSCKQKCFVECGSNCTEMVHKSLPCGHKAMMQCHIEEEQFFCLEIVDKKFPGCNHEAKVSCSCKSCPLLCDLQAPCGHSCTLQCHTDTNPDHLEYKCTKLCTKINKDCRSNHPCNKNCWEECDSCKTMVKARRSCGHSLDLECHIDPDSTECIGNCRKILSCGHHCLRKCNVECDPCMQPVEKVIPECGHSAKVHCGRETTKDDCTEQCDKILPCGHVCKAKCVEECTTDCMEFVEQQIGDCGHEIKRLCLEKTKGLKANVLRCSVKCNAVLECGHECGGTCKTCHQGRFHVPCKQKCSKELICGHMCPAKCSEPCPPCKQKNSIACDHDEVHESSCGMPRKICKAKCNAKCKHGKCTRQCGMYCNYTRCEEKCPNTLKCGHRCAGFCGSPCPSLCWECDREELLQCSFPFGTESLEDPRFVLLPDCQHTVEAGALKLWFKRQSSRVEIKSCPLCKVKISARLLSYKKEIWEPFDDFSRIYDKIRSHSNSLADQGTYKAYSIAESCKKVGIKSLAKFGEQMKSNLKILEGNPPDLKDGKKQRHGPSIVFINELPLMKMKMKIVKVMLEILKPPAKPTAKLFNVNDVKAEVDFIVSMLEKYKTMSTQHTEDLKNLLCDLKNKVQPGQPAEGVELPEINLLRLRSLWRKCLKCSNLAYSSNQDGTMECSSCKKSRERNNLFDRDRLLDLKNLPL